MILHVDTPDGGTSTPIADGIVHTSGDTTVTALHIRELPADAGRWIRQIAVLGAPPGARGTERARAELTTRDGWMGLCLEVDVSHEAWKRTRIVALYRFLDYAAGAIIDTSTARYEEERDTLFEILRSGRPDWGPQDTTCLSRMFGAAAGYLVTIE